MLLTILVTGAAGLIGGEVCARLTARGHRVIAMVRRTKQVRANNGATVPVARVVQGDVTKPLMGLDPADIQTDLVLHCAAALEFDAPEEVLNAINVEGTRNALAFARAVDADFLHVSTAYVCGLSEGAIREEPVKPGRRFANRYEASKAAAEAVVAASGQRFAIARPSIVLGESENGEIRDFPSLCNVFRLMARGKVSTFPAASRSTLDLVPIDHVAEGIVRIAERMEAAAGGYFHLVADAPMPAAELAHGVARVAHLPNPRVVEPALFDTCALSAVEERVASRMLNTFGSYFQRNPRFDDSRFRALTGLECAPTDSAWFDRLVGYAMHSGYVPDTPSTSQTSERRGNGAPAGRAHPAPTACQP